MVASVSVYLDTGGANNAPGAETDIDGLGPPNLLHKRADNPTIDANDPMIIPAAGTKYSRWKQIYLYCDAAPSLQIDNIKLYTDGGGWGAGITVMVGDEFPVKNSGSDAGYEVADSNDEEMVAGHADIANSTDLFTFNVGAPLSGSISEAGNIINAIGETSNYFVIQLNLTNAASPADLAAETITIQYDEI